jgi:formimidoylglutamate deiminase
MSTASTSDPTTSPTQRLWAAWAWLPEGWQANVLLEVDRAGHWSTVQPGVPCPADAHILSGPALPGTVNAHSHAFQRAFAGCAEHREQADDTFWTWRDRMYRVAAALEPAMLRSIARQLYGELLRNGTTEVCEFHYVHHQADGRPHDNLAAMSQALIDAAADVGIGLTLLPVLYERAGFDQPALRPDQARFRMDATLLAQLHRDLAPLRHARLKIGLAVHSLRAATPDSLQTVARLAEETGAPVHIHVAEQTAEIDACQAATGQRPVEWLARQGLLTPQWQLVHATHVEPFELDAVAASGAGVVICPSTEANLGDGLTDVPGWLDRGVPVSLGSDSQIGRDVREELRWLDYGQRLIRRQRAVCAAPSQGLASTGERLWRATQDGGRRAAGHALWGLTTGARADLLVAEPAADERLGLPVARWIDAMVFSSPATPWRDVMVGGHWRVRGGQLTAQALSAHTTAAEFQRVMMQLWS